MNGFRIKELRTGIKRKVVIMAERKNNNRTPKSRRRARKSSSGVRIQEPTSIFRKYLLFGPVEIQESREPNFFSHSLRCSKREFLRHVS